MPLKIALALSIKNCRQVGIELGFLNSLVNGVFVTTGIGRLIQALDQNKIVSLSYHLQSYRQHTVLNAYLIRHYFISIYPLIQAGQHYLYI